jgi:diacylglycerol kinase family enzyme
MTGACAFALIVNARARGTRRGRWSADSWRGAGLPDERVRVTRDLSELAAAVTEFRAAGAEVIAAVGGDGTLHHLVNLLLASDASRAPAVLPLAGGTMNGLARAFGGGGPPARVLRSAMIAWSAGRRRITERRVLQVTNEGEATSRLGFGFAAGLVYRALEFYARRPDPGLIDAVRASLLPLTGLGRGFYDCQPIEVEADGNPWLPEPAHSVAASVVDRPLLWFEPFGGPLRDGVTFHLAATSMRPRELVPRLWSVFRGHCRHPRLRTGPARDVSLRAASGYVLDGELFSGAPPADLRIRLGPVLRLAASAPARR